MAKKPVNHGKPVAPAVITQGERLAAQSTPTRVIGIEVCRTEDSVRNIATTNDISLRPTNQSPYGTK